MKCKHCGADNFNESKFCFQCGQELSSDDVQHSEDPPVDPTHPICKNCGASNTADLPASPWPWASMQLWAWPLWPSAPPRATPAL